MFFRLVYDEMLAQAAYVVGCQRTREVIVVDPARDVDRYLRLAAAEGMRLVAAVETHIHADFLSGARELVRRAGATAYLPGTGGEEWRYRWARNGEEEARCRLLSDGEVFRVGGVEFRAVHTPGHTPEHMCYLLTDRGSGATEPMGVFTGDALFVGDAGRPDLLETAVGQAGSARESARALRASLQALAGLPEYLQVWPAHGAGSACGKALGAVPQSTIGYERRFNPALRALNDLQGFLAYVLEGQPEPPLYFGRMKRQNRDGPPILGDLPSPRRVSGAEAMRLADETIVLDTRPWDGFRAGHLRGALYVPLNQNFIPVAGSYVPDASRLGLVVDPDRLGVAVRCLVRIGLDRIEWYVPPGAIEELRSAGAALETTPEVDVASAARAQASGEAVVLDVRRADERAEGCVPGSVHVPHTRLAERLAVLPRGRRILVHCAGGTRSSFAATYLRREGFDAVNVAGGFKAWERGGLPIERGGGVTSAGVHP